jgi:cysteine desulfurase/selenocysteine lyase
MRICRTSFEAGTPHIAGAVGLGAAIDFINSVGLQNAHAHEEQLLNYATEKLNEVRGLRIIGTAANKASVISFVLEDPVLSSHDAGVILDMDGIAIRTGHHCCQPVMDRMKIASTARASLAMYNTREDIDRLVESLHRAVEKVGSAKPVMPTPTQEVKYPAASATSPQAAADELIEIFDFLGDDPNAKSLYVMEDLGGKLPNYFELLKKSHAAPRRVHERGLSRRPALARRSACRRICRRRECLDRPRRDRVA